MLGLERAGRVDEDTMCIREGDDVYITYLELRPELGSAKAQQGQRNKIQSKAKRS